MFYVNSQFSLGCGARGLGIFRPREFVLTADSGPFYAGQGQPPPVKQPADNMPQLGATFVPGGFDDYYMPEVIAPAPQR